jgi:hypothetical protein
MICRMHQFCVVVSRMLVALSVIFGSSSPENLSHGFNEETASGEVTNIRLGSRRQKVFTERVRSQSPGLRELGLLGSSVAVGGPAAPLPWGLPQSITTNIERNHSGWSILVAIYTRVILHLRYIGK